MQLRLFTKQDYPELVRWWEKHDHPVLPFEMLSPAGVLCTTEDNVPACVSFIYFIANCDLAHINWTVTNPDVSLKQRYEALDVCMQGLLILARQNKRTNIMCLSGSNGLTKLYNRHGFKTLKDHKLLYCSLGVL